MAFEDVDAGDALGSTASGALMGSQIHPIYGTIAGGLFGLGSSLFGAKKKKRQPFQDPYKAQRDIAINELSNSRLGAQAASLAAGHAGNLPHACAAGE